MHRNGYIIEEIIQYENLSDSIDKVLSGSKRKKSEQGKKLLANRGKVIQMISDEIASGNFTVLPSDLKEDDIIEGGKHRHIEFFKKWVKSIALNAIMNVVDKYLKPRYIRTTSASIPGRGLHDLMHYIYDDMRKDPEGTRYAYVFDIVRCYENTDQNVAMDAIRRVFKDARLIKILDQCITVLKNGVSIGLRTSASIVNLILSIHLDHKIKSKYRFKHYYRYCDNGLALCDTIQRCLEAQKIVRALIKVLGYEIHNERIFPVTEGVDALGFVIFPDHVMLRKRIKKNFARKLQKVKSRKRRRELIASFYGMAKHADCKNLFKTLTGKDMRRYSDFKFDELKTENGEKIFEGRDVNMQEIDRKAFIVLDFECKVPKRDREEYMRELQAASLKGIDQSTIEQPKKKYLVSLILNGEKRKLWTGSKRACQKLDRAREEEDGLPAFWGAEIKYTGPYKILDFVDPDSLGIPYPSDAELAELEKKFNIKLIDDEKS